MGLITHSWRLGLAAFVAALVIRLPTLFLPFTPGPDETAYLGQATILRAAGVSGLQKWMDDYGHDHRLDPYPLPSRLLIVIIDALAGAVGGPGMRPLVAVSYLAGAGLVVVGLLYARALGVSERLLPWLAVLLIVSPVAMAMSHRALSDTVVGLMSLLVLYNFHLCWTRGTSRTALALGASMLGALLAKETNALLYLLLVLTGLYYHFGLKLRLHRRAFLSLALAAAIYGVILVMLAGGVSRLLEIYRAYNAILAQVPYNLELQRGPWFAYFVDWLLVSPFVFLLGFAGLVQLADQTLAQRVCLFYLVAGGLVYAELPVINVRILLFLDPMIRIGALLYLSRWITPASPRFLFPLLVLLLTWTEVLQFYQIFVMNAVYDPVHLNLLEAMDFVNVIAR